MEGEFRSKSCKNGSSNPTGMQDLRCYSTNYSYNAGDQNKVGNFNDYDMRNEMKIKKSKSKGNHGGGFSSSSSSSNFWGFSDPEMQRKKRVASYKVYSVEGKMKGSLRKSFRWIKNVVYGWK